MKLARLLSRSAISSLILAAASAAEPAGHGSGASAATVAPASNEGENAIKTFKFDAGLKVELWAAEPMVANPVAFTQDEKGRWYVAETFRQERGIEDNRKFKQWQDEELQKDLRNLNREVSRWDAEHAAQGRAGIGSLANEEVKKALERVHAAKTITAPAMTATSFRSIFTTRSPPQGLLCVGRRGPPGLGYHPS